MRCCDLLRKITLTIAQQPVIRVQFDLYCVIFATAWMKGVYDEFLPSSELNNLYLITINDVFDRDIIELVSLIVYSDD